MIKHFIKSTGNQLFFLIFFALIFFLLNLRNEFAIMHSSSDGLLYSLAIYFFGENNFISKIFLFFSLFFIGIFLNELFKKFSIIPRYNYSILFAYIIVLGNFPMVWNLSAQLFGILTLLYAIYLLFEASLQEIKLPDLINVSILFSLSSLFYKPLFWLVIYLPIALLLLRQLKFRFLIIMLIMWLLPYVYLYIYYFLFDNTKAFTNIFTSDLLGFNLKANNIKVNTLVPLILTLLIFLISIWKVVNNYSNKLIHIRTITSLTIALLIITAFIIFFSRGGSYINLILLIPTISAIIGISIQYFKKTLYMDIFLIIYIISSIYFYF